MQYDFTLPDHTAGDMWDGIEIKIDVPASTLASAALHMRRQASAADEPVLLWQTADGNLFVTSDPADPVRTVVSVAPRLLDAPGVWFMHLVVNVNTTPKTYATGCMRVRAAV